VISAFLDNSFDINRNISKMANQTIRKDINVLNASNTDDRIILAMAFPFHFLHTHLATIKIWCCT
jgi:hypothetical protein